MKQKRHETSDAGRVVSLEPLREAWVAGRIDNVLQAVGVPGLVRVTLREMRVEYLDGRRMTIAHPEGLDPREFADVARHGAIGSAVFALDLAGRRQPVVLEIAPRNSISLDAGDASIASIARSFLVARGLLRAEPPSAPEAASGIDAFMSLLEEAGDAPIPGRLFQERVGPEAFEVLTARGIVTPPIGSTDGELGAVSTSLRAFESTLADLYEADVARLSAPVHGPLKKIGEQRGRGGARDVFVCYRPWDTALAAALALRERADRRTLALCPTGRHLPSELVAHYGPGGRVEIVLLDDALDITGAALVLKTPLAPLTSRRRRGEKKPVYGLVLPKPSSWDELYVYLIDDHTVLLKVGAHETLATYADLRMAHDNLGVPLWSWQILMITCRQAGRFSMNDDPDRVKTRLVEFRKTWKGLFGLADNPFDDFRKRRGGWRARFHALPAPPPGFQASTRRRKH